jgi:hypothetical protein
MIRGSWLSVIDGEGRPQFERPVLNSSAILAEAKYPDKISTGLLFILNLFFTIFACFVRGEELYCWQRATSSAPHLIPWGSCRHGRYLIRSTDGSSYHVMLPDSPEKKNGLGLSNSRRLQQNIICDNVSQKWPPQQICRSTFILLNLVRWKSKFVPRFNLPSEARNREIEIIFKDSVRTSRKTKRVSMTTINWLMLRDPKTTRNYLTSWTIQQVSTVL